MPKKTVARSAAPARKMRKEIVERPVARHLPLEKRPRDEEEEDDERHEHAAPERIRDERVVPDRDVEARHQPKRADQPAEVPVRLRTVRCVRDVIRPPEPDRVDLDEASEEKEKSRDG
jgi:hypothetical protein